MSVATDTRQDRNPRSGDTHTHTHIRTSEICLLHGKVHHNYTIVEHVLIPSSYGRMNQRINFRFRSSFVV